MKINYTYIAGVTLLCSVTSYATTLSTQAVRAYECSNCERLSHVSLSTHWSIQNNQLGHETLHQQVSKKYFLNTTFKNLEKGVDLYTQAPSAVIRITAIQKNSNLKATNPGFKPSFHIKTNKSGLMKLNEASSLLATDSDLDDSYFADGNQTILQLKPELGAGKITLSATPVAGHENDQYIVNVFDKNAETSLKVKTNQANYHYGDKLTATITLADNTSDYPIDSVKADLVSPDGEQIPMTLAQQPNHSYIATTSLESEKNSSGNNWYIETDTSATVDGQVIKRHAHTALSYAIPSAVISEINESESSPLTFTATVNIATGSRYALEGVLFVTNDNGEKIPVEVAQSAAWLTPGRHEMTFSFSPGNKKSASGQLYISALQLIDYGQMEQVFEYNQFIPVNTSF